MFPYYVQGRASKYFAADEVADFEHKVRIPEPNAFTT